MAGQGGINIPIGGDASKFLRETDDVKDALDDVADALDEAAKESKVAGRDGERSFKDLTDEVKDTDRAADKLTDTFDETRRKARDVGDDGGKSFTKVKEGAQEVTSEIGSNLGEAVSSVRGNLGDLAQVGQDTLGGLAATLSGLGPAGIVGAALLAAAAVGAGGLAAEIENAQKEADALRQRASDVATAWVNAGQQIINGADLADAIGSIVGDDEQMKRADELTKKLGIDRPTAIRILANDQNALNALLTQYHDKQARIAEIEALREGNNGRLSKQRRDELGDLRAWTSEYQKQKGVYTDASTLFNDATRAQSDSLLALIDDAKAATIQTDKLGNKLVEIPGQVPIYIDAKTGKATTNIEQFKSAFEKIPKNKAVTVQGTVDMSDVTRGINNYKPPRIDIRGRLVDRHGRVIGE